MTQEQYEKLIPYEQDLRYITKLQFMSLTQQRFNELMVIYEDVFGESLNQRQRSCPTCRMKACNRLGQAFDEYRQQIAEEQKEERLKEAQEAQNKKKVGRPKKIDLNKE